MAVVSATMPSCLAGWLSHCSNSGMGSDLNVAGRDPCPYCSDWDSDSVGDPYAECERKKANDGSYCFCSCCIFNGCQSGEKIAQRLHQWTLDYGGGYSYGCCDGGYDGIGYGKFAWDRNEYGSCRVGWKPECVSPTRDYEACWSGSSDCHCPEPMAGVPWSCDLIQDEITKSVECVPCEQNTYRNASALSDRFTCHSCGDHEWSNEGAASCIPCLAHSIRNSDWDGTAGEECELCPAGTERPSGQENCEACGANEVGISGGPCTTCETWERPNFDKTACEGCTGGQYMSAEGICTSCPSGYYSTGTGDSCKQCAAGEILNNNQTGCEYCATNAKSSPGDSICEKCPVNQVRSNETGAACMNCPNGQERTGLQDSLHGGCLKCGGCLEFFWHHLLPTIFFTLILYLIFHSNPNYIFHSNPNILLLVKTRS